MGFLEMRDLVFEISHLRVHFVPLRAKASNVTFLFPDDSFELGDTNRDEKGVVRHRRVTFADRPLGSEWSERHSQLFLKPHPLKQPKNLDISRMGFPGFWYQLIPFDSGRIIR
jgi:hypothetical protein